MMEGGRSDGDEQLRALGRALDGIGWSWILVLLAGNTGLTINGHEFLPLLWGAPPWLLSRLSEASRSAPEPVRRYWSPAVTLGMLTWIVAVAASLAGVEVVKNTAYMIGTSGGVLLFCSGFVVLTRSLGWTEHVRHWRTARHTELLSLGLVLVFGLVVALGLFEGDGVGPVIPVAVALGYGGVAVLALLRVRRSLRATRAGLLARPRAAGLDSASDASN